MRTQPHVPDDDPLAKPNVARMYDYFLGGYHNFAADRATAEQVRAIYPDASLVVQAVDQFLDIGSGIPTVGNVHEVAHRANPAARIVYVDSDPVAVIHSQTMLEGNPNVGAIEADARRPEDILNHPTVRRLLDFGKPLAVLLVALLHFITDDDEAYGVVRVLRDALTSGSYIAISHAIDATENAPRTVIAQSEKLYARSSNPGKTCSRAQIEQFFTGLELVEPGLVYTPRWRPEGPRDVFLDQPGRSVVLAGVGRKP